MSGKKKTLSSGRGKGDGFWQVLMAMNWEGADMVSVFTEFVDIMFCSLVHGNVEYEGRPLFQKNREKKIEGVKTALEVLGEEMMQAPFRDLLGAVHQEISSVKGRQALASFYTPDDICRLVGLLGADVGEMKRRIGSGETVSLYDPACGSARMVLALAGELGDLRQGLRVTCVDIELTACRMAYINLSMWGIPAEVYHGDTLRGQYWGGWRTRPLALELAMKEETQRLRRSMEWMKGLVDGGGGVDRLG